jgi:hypothetical protein
MAKEVGLTQSAVHRIWRAFGLQPHRQETWKLSKDPQFVAKVRDIVDLYLDPPERQFCASMRRCARAIRTVFDEVLVRLCVRHKECHEDGDVRHRGQPRGRSRPRGVPSCSIRTLGSTGQRAARGGAR